MLLPLFHVSYLLSITPDIPILLHLRMSQTHFFLPSPILSYSHRDVQPKVPEQSGREVGGALEEDSAGAGGLPVGLEELLDLVETLPNAEGEGKGRERE